MKIVVSGWPGAGSSTLTLLLAYLYEFKLYRGGGVFRYIFEQLNLGDTGINRVRAQELIQPTFGKIFDKFIDNLLTDSTYNNLIIESDIASFRIGKRPDVLSVFLKASQSERISRTKVDGRPADGKVMDLIDKSHETEYFKLHNIKFFDTEEIENNYTLVIDNTSLTIKEELKIVGKYIREHYKLNPAVADDFNKIEDEFWKYGKNYFLKKLTEKGLIPEPPFILNEIKEKFKSDVKNLPEFIQEIFMQI
jgi:cytidylate kinase